MSEAATMLNYVLVDLRDIRNIARGLNASQKAKIRTLAKIWADRLCGKHNKDIKLILVGPQGSGKSHTSIYIAIRVAEEIALILGGTWEDYFPRDLSHVYIGDPEAHADALKHLKKHSIYILDDAGVSLNARKFMTSYNQSLNDIFQTVRTDNCLIIINAPDTFLVDNVPRNIFSRYGEISESMHSQGINLVKIFQMERKFRSGETHFHYYQFGNDQVVRWIARAIPEDMTAIYEKRRDEATQAIKANAGGKAAKGSGEDGRAKSITEGLDRYESVIMEVIKNGGGKKDVIDELHKHHNLPNDKLKRWVTHKVFDDRFPTCK